MRWDQPDQCSVLKAVSRDWGTFLGTQGQIQLNLKCEVLDIDENNLFLFATV